MPITSFSTFINEHYEIIEWRHASAILATDFPDEFHDLSEVLESFRLRKSSIVEPGGRKSKVLGWIDDQFYKRGWVEKSFDTKISIDNVEIESPTHSVDCFKSRVAL